MKDIFGFIIAILLLGSCRSHENTVADTIDTLYREPHRLQVHFSPEEKWMNDPNGMVYHNGEYHLFYQHYPDSTVWGPMHWGHAVSSDLVHWTQLPIALYPDSLGLIFSGNSVVDVNNTSGLGTKENPPIVALFTYHSLEKEKSGRTDYQSQGLAYSTDGAKTWRKYDKNPVIRNPGVKDFRDPKILWHDDSEKWIMALAAGDHVDLYASSNLKEWSKLSEFGKAYGAHGGVWECPELALLPVEGERAGKWVLMVSINPGGPNGGSATQY
ncbi:MAG TPA: glycoside hydrolase family 32 protein, partial [Chryseosolibacter sp.]|nr:glycoside hydrolase family 32 protein [Chryseosolibacter sp.]